MRDQSKRPSPLSKEKFEMKKINTREENLCFRCCSPLEEEIFILKEEKFCKKCYEIMKQVWTE